MTCVTKVNQANPHFHLLQNCAKFLNLKNSVTENIVYRDIIVCNTMHYFWRIIAVKSIAILQSALHSFNCTADSAVQLNEYNLLQCAEKASSNSWWVGGWKVNENREVVSWTPHSLKPRKLSLSLKTFTFTENFHFHWKLSLSSVASLKTRRNNTKARKRKVSLKAICVQDHISCHRCCQNWAKVLKSRCNGGKWFWRRNPVCVSVNNQTDNFTISYPLSKKIFRPPRAPSKFYPFSLTVHVILILYTLFCKIEWPTW